MSRSVRTPRPARFGCLRSRARSGIRASPMFRPCRRQVSRMCRCSNGSVCSARQANTPVEPEFNLLWPPGVAMINARLMSDKSSMSDRLVDYFDNYGASLRQFANAPVGVVGAACTGASYLAGREREAAVVADIEARSGHRFVTAALAVV